MTIREEGSIGSIGHQQESVEESCVSRVLLLLLCWEAITGPDVGVVAIVWGTGDVAPPCSALPHPALPCPKYYSRAKIEIAVGSATLPYPAISQQPQRNGNPLRWRQGEHGDWRWCECIWCLTKRYFKRCTSEKIKITTTAVEIVKKKISNCKYAFYTRYMQFIFFAKNARNIFILMFHFFFSHITLTNLYWMVRHFP